MILVIAIILFAVKKHFSGIKLITVGIIVGFLISGLYQPVAIDSSLYGKKINVAGVVDSDPEYRETYQRFYLKTQDVRLLVSTDMYQKIFIGDHVVVSGELNLPESFVSESGRRFDYVNFPRAKSVVGIVSYATVHKGIDQPRGIKSRLGQIKRHYLKVIASHIPEPQSSLAGGITVGASDAMGEKSDRLFRRVGLTHIVVLSGYNVAIVVLALSTALAYLPYWLSATVSIGGIWLFVLLVGGSATIVRAGIMTMIAVVSRLYGSQLSGLTLLSLAVILMLVHNPLILLYDPSFQLSVLATIGILVVSPIIDPFFKRIPKKFGLREIVVTTLATQLTVIPWIVYLIGDFSVVSPLANVLVLPIIPIAMASVFLIYVLSTIWIMSIIATLISFILLSYIFKVSEFIGSWQYASLTLPPISIWIVGLIYLFIFYVLKKVKSSFD